MFFSLKLYNSVSVMSSSLTALVSYCLHAGMMCSSDHGNHTDMECSTHLLYSTVPTHSTTQ